MSEDRHVAFDTELCAKNPEAAADRIAELESGLERLEAIEKAASLKEELLEALQAVASILPKYEMKGDTASDDEALSAVLEMVTDAIAKATA